MLKKATFWCFSWLAVTLLCPFDMLAQRQLILLSGDKVVHRYRVGDTFYSKLKGDAKEHWGFLVELDEFGFITSQDTIAIKDVKRVLKPGKPLVNKLGKTLMIVGVGYLAIDQFNYVVVQGNSPPRVSKEVWKPSAILFSMGLPLVFKTRDWRKMGGGMRLISVDRTSRFYRIDP
jgi:hypothetical protein